MCNYDKRKALNGNSSAVIFALHFYPDESQLLKTPLGTALTKVKWLQQLTKEEKTLVTAFMINNLQPPV